MRHPTGNMNPASQSEPSPCPMCPNQQSRLATAAMLAERHQPAGLAFSWAKRYAERRDTIWNVREWCAWVHHAAVRTNGTTMHTGAPLFCTRQFTAYRQRPTWYEGRDGFAAGDREDAALAADDVQAGQGDAAAEGAPVELRVVRHELPQVLWRAPQRLCLENSCQLCANGQGGAPSQVACSKKRSRSQVTEHSFAG